MRWLVRAALLLAVVWAAPAEAQLRCGKFTDDVIAQPEPRAAQSAVRRFEVINAEVKSVRHRLLFLGNSLTERFPINAPEVWQAQMAPRGVLNAGVSGDRTEHLLWRLQNGNLDGPPPAGAIVLIGTNDLFLPRPPEHAAEGIRANLSYLRQRLPAMRILLLGLLPRSESADALLRRGTVEVNRLIAGCSDDNLIVYADIGSVLLDPDGRLSQTISPDHLHLSAAGYGRLAPRLDGLIDRLFPAR
jgi:lysophospholipase L1-like esterase